MVKAGIIGATGYAGVELLRLLLLHPEVDVVGISSESFRDMDISEVYPNLVGSTGLKCLSMDEVIDKSEVVFTALPHGLSEDIAYKCDQKGIVIIDLGADFRLEQEEEYKNWYGFGFKYRELHEIAKYGLCELNREKIKSTKIIGNPGCYPTSIILGMAPLLKQGVINPNSIIVDSKSGVTGSGRGLNLGSHYPECNESIKAYKIASHRHLPEIEQELSKLADEKITITFTPHLVPMNRGILSTIYCEFKSGKFISEDEIRTAYKEFYNTEKFVRIMPQGKNPETKNVTGSNFCDIGINVDNRTGRIIIVSAIDNMFKGAAGQAVQNMNIIFGFSEDTGLKYIPSAF